jgi:parallel beta-helix repeat protein
MKRTCWFLTAVPVVLLFLLVSSQALATHVGCGDVITTDTTLDSDLIGCPGDGLVIGADGITIDLGGHTIAGAPSTSGSGIDDHLQHDGVVVENGTITTFVNGVLLNRSSDSVLRRLTVSDAVYGLALVDSSDNTVERNSISDTRRRGRGISVQGESDRNTVEKNSISGENVGIALEARFVEPTLKIPDGNLVRKNELRENDFGVFLALALRNRVDENLFADNLTGVFALGLGQNVIDGNDLARGDGDGIQVLEGDDNRLSGNRVRGYFDGIFVWDGSKGTIVESNTASHNVDDGIDVDDPATTLTGNVANENGDLGIEAVPGVTDGGGNKARGNGNPLQCLNVFCK